MSITAVFQSLRPKQWIKNLIIFASLIFSASFLDAEKVFRTLAAFGIFCLLSGAVYVLNDILDVEKDRRHPLKSRRPIASGKLKVSHAKLLVIALLAGSLGAAFWLQPSLFAPVEQGLDLGPATSRLLQPSFFLVAVIYFIITALYSIKLKQVVVLDVMIIASASC